MRSVDRTCAYVGQRDATLIRNIDIWAASCADFKLNGTYRVRCINRYLR